MQSKDTELKPLAIKHGTLAEWEDSDKNPDDIVFLTDVEEIRAHGKSYGGDKIWKLNKETGGIHTQYNTGDYANLHYTVYNDETLWYCYDRSSNSIEFQKDQIIQLKDSDGNILDVTILEAVLTSWGDIYYRISPKLDKNKTYIYGPYKSEIVNQANGYASVAEGFNTKAEGDYSHAEGKNTTASGEYSHAEGSTTTGTGEGSHAEGSNTTASGDYSHSEGGYTKASGYCSHAEGNSTTASEDYSHAEGYKTEAKGQASHAEGFDTEASGSCAHAEGSMTVASGDYSHAEGEETVSSGSCAHTEGSMTVASGDYSHAEGSETIASGNNSHAEGCSGTTGVGSGSHAEGGSTKAIGYYSHSEGENTEASGSASHAEGYMTKASGSYSHSEGQSTKALGTLSHAEGYVTVASGYGSHSEGNYTTASKDYSHAEGSASTGCGKWSHAEGERTKSIGVGSHAEGYDTAAVGDYSHAEGMQDDGWRDLNLSYYSWSRGSDTIKVSDDNWVESGVILMYYDNEPHYFVSRGDVATRTMTLDKPIYAYKYQVSGMYKIWGVATGKASHIEGCNTTAPGSYSHSEGWLTESFGKASHAEGKGTYAYGENSHAEGGESTAEGDYSHVEGSGTTGTGYASHAEGIYSKATGRASHAEGEGTRAQSYTSHAEGQGTTASGSSSHAEGDGTRATSHGAHSEGQSTEASGGSSHAEGYYTIASGNNSHAEGQSTRATSYNTHAEGQGTTSSGLNSHAEGESTIASGLNSHAEGEGSISGLTGYSWGLKSQIIEFNSAPWITIENILKIVNNEEYLFVKVTAISEDGLTITVDKQISLECDGSSLYVVRGVAYGDKSHSEGNITVASGYCSHTEGSGTTGTGGSSHAEGGYTTASGQDSHAEGCGTVASGPYSHVEGSNTEAKNDSEHAQGRYNISHTSEESFGSELNTIHSIGIGSHDVRKNAQEVMQNGDFYIIGVGNYNGTNIQEEGVKTLQEVLEDISDSAKYTSGDNISIEDNEISAVGYKYDKEKESFSVGSNTTASGKGSHAEGLWTEASGPYSHAEGSRTIASSHSSHVEGSNTEAKNNYEHAQGRFNVSNKKSDDFGDELNTIHSIGVGTNDKDRKNAQEVMQNGDYYVIGIGGYDGTNPEEATRLQDIVAEHPKVQNKLTYSDDGQTLTSHPLLYNDMLVVDTEEDYNKCTEVINQSSSEILKSWTVFGSGSVDKNAWGYCSSNSNSATMNVNTVGGSSENVPVFRINGQPQDYIFNVNNTNSITGYYSPEKFANYDYVITAGIIPSLQIGGYQDYQAIILALSCDNQSKNAYGVSLYAENQSDSVIGRGDDDIVGNKTIKIIVWKQDDLNKTISSEKTILTYAEGLRIIPYDSDLNNSSGNGNTKSSCIQLRTVRQGNILKVYSSKPYRVQDENGEWADDSKYSVEEDLPITIDLLNYKLSYKYYDNDNNIVTVNKDFSNEQIVKDVFDKLRGAAYFGYEAESNPGTFFRYVSGFNNNKIINVVGNNYQIESFNPQTSKFEPTSEAVINQLKNGSRLAYNRITKKLFYFDGYNFIHVATVKDDTMNAIESKIAELDSKVDSINTQVSNSGVPKGTVIDWYGDASFDNIPYGWVPCGYFYQRPGGDYSHNIAVGEVMTEAAKWKNAYPNISTETICHYLGENLSFLRITKVGQMTIPNLSGRFIVSAGYDGGPSLTRYQNGDTGGEERHKLTAKESGLPSHNHSKASLNITTAGSDRRSLSAGNNTGSLEDIIDEFVTGGAIAKDAESSHENRPPYYALWKLIKVI